ncbi:hypothetical protein ACS0PU_003770 [Formica fusca]
MRFVRKLSISKQRGAVRAQPAIWRIQGTPSQKRSERIARDNATAAKEDDEEEEEEVDEVPREARGGQRRPEEARGGSDGGGGKGKRSSNVKCVTTTGRTGALRSAPGTRPTWPLRDGLAEASHDAS